jgi:hypothetical protein
MTNRFLVSVAALALIAGTGLANAQGGRDSGGGAQMQSAPSTASGGAAGGAATEHESSKGGSAGMKSEKSPSAGQGQRAEDNMSRQKSKSMSSENETKGAPNNMKAEGREDRNADKSAQKESRENERNAQTQGNRENMRAQGRSETTVGQAGAGAKLSTEQRSKITTIIRSEHVAPVNNVDFAVSVGTRVPRDRVHLVALPGEVVTVYPEWRGYEFFMVGDKIVVVDPRTLEIVDVLEA